MATRMRETLESGVPGLYLYGRRVSCGKPQEANEDFKERLRRSETARRGSLKMNEAAAQCAMKTGNWQTAQVAAKALDE